MGENPWGLSGEQFLEWYFIGLGCAIALAVLIRFVPKFSGGYGNDVFRPSAVETGFLAGGPDRAVETAVAELLAAGALRIGSAGMIHAIGAAKRTSPVGAQVLERAAGSHSLRDITEHVRSGPALRTVGQELAQLGLVVPAHVAARFRLSSALPVFAVLVVGVVRWVNGLVLGRAIGILTPSLLAAVLLFVILLNFRRRRHLRTFAGDRAVRELRGTPSQDAATAVALDGVAKYPDVRTADALRRSKQLVVRSTRTGASAGAAAGGFFVGGGGGCGGGGGGCGGGGCGG
jgi:uncharacterized protein (TIGR04222 family)